MGLTHTEQEYMKIISEYLTLTDEGAHLHDEPEYVRRLLCEFNREELLKIYSKWIELSGRMNEVVIDAEIDVRPSLLLTMPQIVDQFNRFGDAIDQRICTLMN